MKKILLLALISFTGIANATMCLDISGSYINFPSGNPGCAQGQRVIKSWYVYKQNACAFVDYSKVYKLADGSFCESQKFQTKVTDVWVPAPNPAYKHKLEILADRHVLSLQEISTGSISGETKSIDKDGNLVVESFGGTQTVLVKSTVQ